MRDWARSLWLIARFWKAQFTPLRIPTHWLTPSRVVLKCRKYPGFRTGSQGGLAMTQQLLCSPLAMCLAAAALVAMPAAAQQQQHIGDQPEALNMRLVGYNDLQARSAYQPVIQKQGDRFILYVGHHGGGRDIPQPIDPMTAEAEFNGTSIVDVTDPTQPKYLKHLPAVPGLGEAGGAQMVRTCAGKDLPNGDPNKFYLLRVLGGQGHEIWDVTDPANPSLLTRIVMGLRDTQ